MEILDENFKHEQKYLDNALKIIKEQIKDKENDCEKGIDYVQKLSKYHWQYRSEMDEVERATLRYDVNFSAKLTNSELSRLKKLRKAYDNPYFGKLNLEIEGEQEEIYIGLIQIMEDYNNIVTDWRSPIASLFYNSKLGNTEYKAPMGMISCNLEQRKQIKIDNGKIKRILESDLYINDDELQEVLSKSSTGKMKNIVSTIQEEQNEVIRNLNDNKIIVQGCAGSGKTSVALHRIAYLLYNDKKSKAENMLILSPSDTFSSYISNVLPELGEDNVMQTTFSDFANSFVSRFEKLESFTEFVSKYYENINTDEKNSENKFKFTIEYKDALDKFIKKLSNSYRFKDDFSYNDLTIPCSYMNRLVDSLSNDKTSLQDKIDLIADDIFQMFSDKKSLSKNGLKKKIAKELIKPAFDPRIAYNKFLESEEYINAFGKKGKKLNIKLLEYPDLLGLLYLNFEIVGYPDNNLINHLVIDEVQDYVPLQMEMISKMFNGATITALGDCNQTINPYHKYESLNEMSNILGRSTKYMELNKAYRSSPEIMNYVKSLINNEKIIPVRNSQNVPVSVKEVDKNDIFKTLISDILKLKENGLEKICIITRSNKEAKALYESFKDKIDNLEILTDTLEYNNNLYVAASYLAKGLEFDAVISYNSKDNPYEENDKYLYYVACTRAQHNLIVYNEPKVLKRGK